MAMKKRNPNRSGARRSKPYRVFISHATHDKWIARMLCEKFEAAGAETFRDDRDIEGGESIPNAILSEIRRCDEFVVLLTPESVDRQWVLVEIGIAIGVELRIIPLIYHIDTRQIPDIIGSNRGFDLNDLDDYVADLRKRLESR